MGKFISPSVFGAIFSAGYAALAIYDWTPFLYYPLTNEISRTALPVSSGPSMHLYGWVLTAAVAAVTLSALIPSRWTKGVERPLAWIPAAFAIVAILIYEKKWFL
jgi:hypothetical protein